MMKKYLINFFLWYLRALAKIQLNKINPIIIGIGGASGKSSLTQITSQLLSQKYIVKQGKGKNSETGIPLNILDIEIDDYSLSSWIKIAAVAPLKLITNNKKYDIFVVEMGIDSPYPPKNMSYLLSFIKPRISVLTNISLEHSVYFEDFSKSDDLNLKKKEILDKIASEEKLLLTSIDPSGRVIVNLDDEYVKDTLPLSAKVFTISAKDNNADFFIEKIKIHESSFDVELKFLNEEYRLTINQPLPRYYAYIFTYAIAIAFSNEINIKDSINYIQENFTLPPGRFGVFKGIKSSTIFDSSYNSSLEASVGALETLKEIGKDKRKVGILGDMRELGSLSQLQHELLANEIIKNLDSVILIGPQMKEFVEPILEKNNFEFKSFNNFKEAKDFIEKYVRRNDLILVKGSQNTLFLERVVELLILDKKDKEFLCRRGKYWDKIRQRAD